MKILSFFLTDTGRVERHVSTKNKDISNISGGIYPLMKRKLKTKEN